jgi:hypothetical protein
MSTIVPDDLSHKARWARAQGHGGVIANHPNAVSAVGSDGGHPGSSFSALWHLARANQCRQATPSVLITTPSCWSASWKLIKQFETKPPTSRPTGAGW